MQLYWVECFNFKGRPHPDYRLSSFAMSFARIIKQTKAIFIFFKDVCKWLFSSNFKVPKLLILRNILFSRMLPLQGYSAVFPHIILLHTFSQICEVFSCSKRVPLSKYCDCTTESELQPIMFHYFSPAFQIIGHYATMLEVFKQASDVKISISFYNTEKLQYFLYECL